MFINAIEQAAQFTRAIHTIMRTYGGKQLIPGAATIFFVNSEGYAVTCKHVVEMLANADHINNHFIEFKKEKLAIANHPKYRQLLKGLELKYKYQQDTVIQIKNNFVDSVDSLSGFTWHLHPTLDLAILKFNDFKKTHYGKPAHFLKDNGAIKQGAFLCRLGFPFAEFSNYTYNAATDDIEWTKTGIQLSPMFPLEGMVTRLLGDNTNSIYGIEMSTPGLRGQSGGPLFNEHGVVYGMQFSTKHLHLGFDLIDKEIMLNNGIKKVTDYSFIHLGQCINADAIKAFLKEKGVAYYEADAT